MENNERKLTFVDHLDELRKRIIISLSAALIGTITTYTFKEHLYNLITTPISGKLVYLTPTEAFLAYIKISIIGGVVIASPIILYQIWRFVSPAFLWKERKYLILFLPFVFILFICGICFGYFILGSAIKFLLSFGNDNLKPMISIGSYISFTLILLLSCGIIFEMPAIAFLLGKLSILNSQVMRKQWKYAMLGVLLLQLLLLRVLICLLK